MKYFLVAFSGDFPNYFILYHVVGNTIFVSDKGNYKNKQWSLVDGNACNNEKDLLDTIHNEWHCDIVHEFNNLKDLDKILMGFELRR